MVWERNNTLFAILTILQDLNNLVLKACKIITEKGKFNERQ